MIARSISFRVPFATVNKNGEAGFVEGWQRHHALPLQSANNADLGPFLGRLRVLGFYLDDFATNGILLPALPSISRHTALPLHVGGHAHYNKQVISRMHAIRSSCASVIGESAQLQSAMAGFRHLQVCLIAAITGQCAPTLDHLDLSGMTDGDVDHRVRRLFEKRHLSA